MKYLSLVFDDGPSYPMCEIIDKIKDYGWSAGFAIIGCKINSETIDIIKYAINNGFQVVSHGQEHTHVEQLSSRKEMIDELVLPIKTVEQETGYKITMARLPFLSANDEVLSVAKELKLPLLGHGIDGGNDWNGNVTSEQIIKALLSSVNDGAVGCLHVRENTCRALDIILPELKAQGYCLVTPEELILKKGITPPLGVQIHNVNDYMR